MKWSLGRILYVTMLLCFLFGILSLFPIRGAFAVGLILLPLSAATTGAYFSSKWRKPLSCYALFNGAFLAVVLYSEALYSDAPGESANVVFVSWLLGGLSALTVAVIPSD